MQFQVRIPGRICLFGDHCDLIEKPCIAMAVSAQMTFDFITRDDRRVIIVSADTQRTETFRLGEKPNLSTPLKYITAAYLRLASRIESGFEMHVSSEIPIGVGLGSSSALLVGAIQCLNQAFNLGLQKADIPETAYVIERHDLMIECGRMDPYAIAYGGVSYIETGIPPRVTPIPNGERDVCCKESPDGKRCALPIVVGHTGIVQDSDSIQRSLSARLSGMTSEATQAMERVIAIVQEAREALQNEEEERIGSLMNESFEMGRTMEESTNGVAELCAAARSVGALGAKQSGGGGSMVAYCPGCQDRVLQDPSRSWLCSVRF